MRESAVRRCSDLLSHSPKRIGEQDADVRRASDASPPAVCDTHVRAACGDVPQEDAVKNSRSHVASDASARCGVCFVGLH